MVRAVALLLAAMKLTRPEMPDAEGRRYAEALNTIAREQQFDPLVAVAIIHFESRWYPSRVSDDGEDYGLGQVRARFVGPCKDDLDPLGNPSFECLSAKATLLDGVTNIRRMGSIIAANKALCKEKVGSDKDAFWLAGYQGLNDLAHGRFCQPGDKTRQVLDYHDELLIKFGLKKKAPPPRIAKAPTPKASDKATAKAPDSKAAPGKAPAAKAPLPPSQLGKAPAKATASRAPAGGKKR